MKPDWLREPLLHFAAGGALIFALYAWMNPQAPEADGRQVRIGQGEMKWLATTWQRQWGRDPTAEELRELVANLVKEELLAREARELRLDEGDTIVRRRLAQKLEFMLQDTARLAEPSEQDLRRLHAASPEAFLTERRVSFNHRFVSAGAAPRLLEPEFRDADQQTVSAAFGPQFARAVFALRPGAWQGPIESGYGSHLVRVNVAEPARPRPFDEVRALVLERWREQQQRATEGQYFDRLTAKYEVLMDDSVKAVLGK